MKIHKKDILNQLTLAKVWNRTLKVNGISIATVMWDDNPWKVIHEGIKFDQITNEIEIPNPSKIFTFPWHKRTYTPIAEFHTQQELASYILKQLT